MANECCDHSPSPSPKCLSEGDNLKEDARQKIIVWWIVWLRRSSVPLQGPPLHPLPATKEWEGAHRLIESRGLTGQEAWPGSQQHWSMCPLLAEQALPSPQARKVFALPPHTGHSLDMGVSCSSMTPTCRVLLVARNQAGAVPPHLLTMLWNSPQKLLRNLYIISKTFFKFKVHWR